MALKGEAKKLYQREYMRKRRAGLTGSNEKKKPQGLQWSLEQELADKNRPGGENVDNFIPSPPSGLTNFFNPERKDVDSFPETAGEGRGGDIPNNINIEDIPTPPPSDLSTKPCLYGHPGTREHIRRKLKELGIININQLIRTYPAADLIEAISDFERALDEGMKIKSPTGYFRSLLK